jgi:hypothetical protein
VCGGGDLTGQVKGGRGGEVFAKGHVAKFGEVGAAMIAGDGDEENSLIKRERGG